MVVFLLVFFVSTLMGSSVANTYSLDWRVRRLFTTSISLSSCAKVSNSSNQVGIKCWGYNNFKNLGLSTSDEVKIPAKDRPFVPFPLTLTVESIVPGVYGSCGVFSSGGSSSFVYCWGAVYSASNTFTVHDASNMVLINTNGVGVLIDSLRVGMGSESAGDIVCWMDTGHRIHCFGNNPNGMLGTGSTSMVPYTGYVEVDLSMGSEIRDFGLGLQHACALDAGGRVKCWGFARYSGYEMNSGNIGDEPNEMGSNLAYVNLGTGVTVTNISVGRVGTCALCNDQSVRCWGASYVEGSLNMVGNQAGEMGDNLASYSYGGCISGGDGVFSLSMGDYGVVLLLMSGRVCYLGNFPQTPTFSNTFQIITLSDRGVPSPVVFFQMIEISKACLITSGANLYCTGGFSDGKSGLGELDWISTNFSPIPMGNTLNGCQQGEVLTQSPMSCNACNAGNFSTGGDVIACEMCQRGQFSLVASSTCTTCTGGSFSDSEQASVCTQCSLGKFQDAAGASLCLSCGVGTYANTSGQTVCHECPPGYKSDALELDSVDGCTTCGLGSFSLAGSSVCSTCSAGSFSDVSDASACQKCGAGKFLAGTGATGGGQCLLCDVGSFSGEGSSVCTDCGPGTFTNTQGLGACSSCDPGLFSNQFGSSACSKCSPGNFTPASGYADCIHCPVGKYSDVMGASLCGLCQPGEFSAIPGRTACSQCEPGQYSSSPGESECQSCVAGSYSSSTSSSMCAECQPGSFSRVDEAAVCEECPAGTFSDDSGSSICTDCAEGTWSKYGGATFCFPICQPGFGENQVGFVISHRILTTVYVHVFFSNNPFLIERI